MKTVLAVVVSLTCIFSNVVQAGPFTDKLSICLVKNTTPAEQTLLMEWVFTAMTQNPDVHALSKVSKADADRFSRETGRLFTTLLTDRCSSETHDAIKYEKNVALRKSFFVLGQVAMQGLMQDPNVKNYMQGFLKNFDIQKLKNTLKDDQ